MDNELMETTLSSPLDEPMETTLLQPPPPKKTLHRRVLQKVAEKMFAANTPFTSSKTLDSDFMKMMTLSKASARAFRSAYQQNFMIVVDENGGRIVLKPGAPLGKSYQGYGKIDSKWIVFWMLTVGLFKEISVRLNEMDDTLKQVDMDNESPLESLARLFFIGDGEFDKLTNQEFDKSVALPPVTDCEIYRMLGEGIVVPWSTINRIFNLDAEEISILPNGTHIGSTDYSLLNKDNKAPTTKAVLYTMVASEDEKDREEFGVFGHLDPWKRLLVHTCLVTPNLEGLDFGLNGIQFDDMWTNSDRLDEFLEKLNEFGIWIFDELLSSMPGSCCFSLAMDFVTHNFEEQLLDGLKDYAKQKGFKVMEEDKSSIVMRSTVDKRFEIYCNIWDW